MSLRDMLSPAVEDYLKAIFTLQSEQERGEDPVGTTQLADHLDVASASVTNMLKRLDALGLARYIAYKGANLTEDGKAIALEIIRHHRFLETYLREVMGYDSEEMHAEAEHLEHHISEEFEDRLDRMLGYPTHDPHGDPIPDRDGTMVQIQSDPLSACPSGERLIVRRITDTDVDLIRQIEALNLLPGSEFCIDGQHNGSDDLLIQTSDRQMVVPMALLDHVFASRLVETQQPPA